jgi:HK97 gp10 family phage protein
MMGNGYIQIDEASLKRLNLNYKDFVNKVLKNAKFGLTKAAMEIVTAAQKKIKENGSIATGVLRASGSVRPQADETVDAGFEAVYSYYVEHGRKAGKMPPVSMIMQWLYKKHIATDQKKLKSMAFGISKWIAKNGTKAQPFFMPAYEQKKNKVKTIIEASVNNIVESYNGK